MIHLEKNRNTLVKKNNSDGSSFLDIPRTLTFLIEDENGQKGYFTNNDEDVSIELDGNIIFFKVREVTIDNTSFLVAQDFINYVYDLK
jgi:hypothetical protein